jgi:hypothetical protein
MFGRIDPFCGWVNAVETAGERYCCFMLESRLAVERVLCIEHVGILPRLTRGLSLRIAVTALPQSI